MKHWKKLAALCLVLALALSLAACGFTPKLARSAVEMEKIKSFHMDMELELGVALTMMGQESAVEMTVEESMDVQREPLTIAAQILTDVGEERELAQSYLLPGENGVGYVLYVSADGGETWDRQRLSTSELSEHTGYSGTLDQIAMLAKAARSFNEVGTETVNGAPATRYDGELQGSFVTEALENSGLMSSLGEQFGVELDAESLEISGGIPCSVWVDDASGRVVRYEMDMAEAISSVWGTIMEQLSQDEAFSALTAMGLSLSISKAHVSATLSRFDEIGEIVLPAVLE